MGDEKTTLKPLKDKGYSVPSSSLSLGSSSKEKDTKEVLSKNTEEVKMGTFKDNNLRSVSEEDIKITNSCSGSLVLDGELKKHENIIFFDPAKYKMYFESLKLFQPLKREDLSHLFDSESSEDSSNEDSDRLVIDLESDEEP